MIEPLTLWLRYCRTAVRCQLEYRAAFIMQVAGRLVMHCLEVIVIAALFDRFGAIRGWRIYEVLMFYGIVNIAFAVAEGMARGFDIFD